MALVKIGSIPVTPSLFQKVTYGSKLVWPPHADQGSFAVTTFARAGSLWPRFCVPKSDTQSSEINEGSLYGPIVANCAGRMMVCRGKNIGSLEMPSPAREQDSKITARRKELFWKAKILLLSFFCFAYCLPQERRNLLICV